MLTAQQERKAIELLNREERKKVARERLYRELAEKRRLWSASR